MGLQTLTNYSYVDFILDPIRSAGITSSDYDVSGSMETFVLRNGLKFKIHLQDIFKVQTRIIVSGEDRDLSELSVVAQRLAQQQDMNCSDWKEKLLDKHGPLTAGQVYETRIHSKLSFLYSYTAIVSHYKAGSDVEWKSEMADIYSSIVGKADEMRVRDVVMPLLGTG